jgi:hypothetical protein
MSVQKYLKSGKNQIPVETVLIYNRSTQNGEGSTARNSSA